MPTLMSVTKESMNYASVVFAGFIIIAAVWYGVWGYHNYRGPPTDAVERDSISPEPSAFAEVPKKELSH
jgi:beta-lactam-binding protein with PASTA domain